ncbi:hypothetical protein LTR12_013078 [Friedmanniomyces endolithicus]|nr:hypothetical protein LTR12_013078 [Friedmanniomyces endolithicus]
MSGAEAIVAVQLIDACTGITKTIIDIGRAVLSELRDIFRKACPKDGDDRGKRIWKGAKAVFFGRDSQLQKLLGTIQDNFKLLEQKEMYVIGDKLDALLQHTEALAQDDGGKYTHSGAGNIVANEGGTPTNYVQGGEKNRQINNPGVYHEGPAKPIVREVRTPTSPSATITAASSWHSTTGTSTSRQLAIEGRGRWLLVLDNADDAGLLLEPPATTGEAQPAPRRIDYIPTCDHGSVVITTRSKKEPLRVVYESDIVDVLPVSEGEAGVLLESKLGQPSQDNRELVLALDCMPLAIAQAAGYIRERRPRYSVQQDCREMERSRASRTSLLLRNDPLLSQEAEAHGSVLLTWQISFEHIHETRRSAAELLSLMGFCDRLAIPEILLRVTVEEPSGSADGILDFVEDIVVLRRFSFVSLTADAQTGKCTGWFRTLHWSGWKVMKGLMTSASDLCIICILRFRPGTSRTGRCVVHCSRMRRARRSKSQLLRAHLFSGRR